MHARRDFRHRGLAVGCRCLSALPAGPPTEKTVLDNNAFWRGWVGWRTVELLTAGGRLIPIYDGKDKRPRPISASTSPPANWMTREFDDSLWAQTQCPFGINAWAGSYVDVIGPGNPGQVVFGLTQAERYPDECYVDEEGKVLNERGKDSSPNPVAITDKRGEELGLTDDEVAFYDAPGVNDRAVKVLGDATLRTIAQELVQTVRRSVTIDCTVRENVRGKRKGRISPFSVYFLLSPASRWFGQARGRNPAVA